MKIFLAIIALMTASSCVMLNAPSGSGLLYTEVAELVYYDPYIKPNQRSMLCAENILGLVSSGDMSFEALKLRSSIRKIATIEKTYSSRFFVFGESCVIIKGE